jgi:hypothetical protein
MRHGLIFTTALLITAIVGGACAHTRGWRKHRVELYKGDSIFIERTVAVYDSFVRSHMGYELPIGEAYKRFFAKNMEEVYCAGDYDAFTPDSTFVYEWTSDLVSGKLHNFLIRPVYISPMPGNPVFPQWPSGWGKEIVQSCYGSGFTDFARSVSKVNPVWKDFVESVEAAGDIWVPYIRSMYEEMNFDNKHECFLAVIGFMNGCLYHRDFNMVKDVRRNDSLKAVWKIEMERRKNEDL